MKSRLVVFAVCAVFGVRLFGAEAVWDVNGSGGWADSSRWRNGVKPVSGCTVYLNGAAYATVRAADWDTFALASVVQVGKDATLVFDLPDDRSFAGRLGGTGRIVKLNSASLSLSADPSTKSSLLFSGCLSVSNGTMHIQGMSSEGDRWPLLEVADPGVLTIGRPYGADAFLCQGLVGDGKIVSEYASLELALMGPASEVVDSPLFAFSGKLSGTMNISAGRLGYKSPLRQSISAHSNDVASVLRFYAGKISVGSFGNGTKAAPGSLGWTDDRRLYFFGLPDVETGVGYVGSGEVVSGRDIYIYNRNGTGAFVVDAGATGGLVFSNTWSHVPSAAAAANGQLTRLVLEGSNSVPCAMDGAVTENSPTNGLALVKRGSGTWNFSADERSISGPISVEQGVLGFASIAERGIGCSLGTSTMLTTNFTGAAGNFAVPYAYLLGDGRTDGGLSDIGCMSYNGPTGTVIATVTTRPFAVKGAGGLADGGRAPIRVNGVFSYQEGPNALVLGGSCENVLVNATNGVGSLSGIVKKGSGSWRVGGDVDATSADVKQGTLELTSSSAAPTWYRITFKALQTDTLLMQMRHIAFWDEDGNLVNANLKWKSNADGYAESIAPGEVVAVRNSWVDSTGVKSATAIENMFKDSTAEGVIENVSGDYVTLANTNSWLAFTMRLPAGSKPAVKYDIRAWGSDTGSSFFRDVKTWTVEGSADGLVWTELSSVTDADAVIPLQGWHSTKTYTGGFDASELVGYPLGTSVPVPRRAASLSDVSVAEGATFVGNGVEASGIRANQEDGCGTISGVSFCATGTISVNAAQAKPDSIDLGYRFEGCQNVGSLMNWAVVVNGEDVTSRSTIKVDDSGIRIYLSGKGLRIVFR